MNNSWPLALASTKTHAGQNNVLNRTRRQIAGDNKYAVFFLSWNIKELLYMILTSFNFD